MKAIIKDGKVIATHANEQEVEDLYPGAEVFTYEGSLKPGDIDPRAFLHNEDALKALRIKRDVLLRESDWTQLQDAPISQTTQDAWKVYRQALRDLPATLGEKSLVEVEWPKEPK